MIYIKHKYVNVRLSYEYMREKEIGKHQSEDEGQSWQVREAIWLHTQTGWVRKTAGLDGVVMRIIQSCTQVQ